jgi:hypothetical protein
VLLVLPKKILIVTLDLLEIELYLSSSNLGNPPLNQPMNSVLMIFPEMKPTSAKKLVSNTPMLMVTGSMFITVSLPPKTKSTLPLLVNQSTKLLPSHLLPIIPHQPD